MSAHLKAVGCALTAVGITAALALPGIASAATVVNGGFESGDLTGWTAVDAGSGNWGAYSGTAVPGGQIVGPPPEGTYAASSQQSSRGSHILYQDVALAPGETHTLRLSLYWNSMAAFVTPSPASLDYTLPSNQQIRVDVMDPAAATDSVVPSDVLDAVTQTEPADATTQTPTEITADLSPFAGRTVRIRISEVDNMLYLSAAVDDVRVDSVSPSGQPVPDVPDVPQSTPPPPPATRVPGTCVSRRTFAMHARPEGRRLASARVTMNGERLYVRRAANGRLMARVDLAGRPKGTYRVHIDARDASGRHHRETRDFKTCARA